MWGSWIGALIFIFSPAIITLPILVEGLPNWIYLTTGIVISAIIGFLLGWGIHSWIRKVRK